jgi:hypothetical protein
LTLLLKFALTVSLLTAVPGVSQSLWHVPKGRPVLIDGKLEKGEWVDSRVKDLPGLARVRVKRSEEYVFLAIELVSSDDGAVDLYLSPSPGRVYDLHSSAKLGERKLENGAWPEWSWWNNSGWVANISRFDSVKQPYFLPTKVREFQISRARFPGKEWKMMVEVMTPAEPNWRTVAYPPGAKNTDTNGWVMLKFE